MSLQPRTAILFICLGNICRSPLAEGVFRDVVAQRGLEHAFEIESAGIGDWHVGSPPDSRSVGIARQFGIDISGQLARQIEPEDFSRFDLIFGMDRANVRALRHQAPTASARKSNSIFGKHDAQTQSVKRPLCVQIDARRFRAARAHIHLFLEYALGQAQEVPDPYYGGGEHFAAVYQMIREACEALVSKLAAREESEVRSGQASSTT